MGIDDDGQILGRRNDAMGLVILLPGKLHAQTYHEYPTIPLSVGQTLDAARRHQGVQDTGRAYVPLDSGVEPPQPSRDPGPLNAITHH